MRMDSGMLSEIKEKTLSCLVRNYEIVTFA